MTEPPEIPVWSQVIIGVLTSLAALGAAWKGWIGQRAAPPSNAPNALVAADIMDTRPMRDLSAAVDRLGKAVDGMVEAQDRTTAAVDRAAAATDRNEAAVRDLCRAVERKTP